MASGMQQYLEQQESPSITPTSRPGTKSLSASRDPRPQAPLLLSLQRGLGNRAVQRLMSTSEQRRSMVQREPSGNGSMSRDAVVSAVLDAMPTEAEVSPARIHAAAARGIQTPATELPYRAQLQPLFGNFDLRQLEAHVGPEASRSASDMDAQAYATGKHVVFDGTPSLHTVAHEAAHVAQQHAGLQAKGSQANGLSLADGVGKVGDVWEQHADAVAQRVTAGQSAAFLLEGLPGMGAAQAGPGPAPVALKAVQRLDKKKDKDKLINQLRRALAPFAEYGVVVPGPQKQFENERNSFFENVWEQLTASFGSEDQKMSDVTMEQAVERYAQLLEAKFGAGARELKPKGVTWNEHTLFQDAPGFLDEDNNIVGGTPLDFEIPKLGKGRIVLYRRRDGLSSNGQLAWVSHGLQYSHPKRKQLDRQQSFGFAVARHENLVRPDAPGGFDDVLRQFDEARGISIPRSHEVPPLVVGAHEAETDFRTSVARTAIGSILKKSDMAVLVDFVPFERVDQDYQNSEMEYLGFSYPPLEAVMQHLPEELRGYEDYLMLCCRTVIAEKMASKGAKEQPKLQLQSFDGPLETVTDVGRGDLRQQQPVEQAPRPGHPRSYRTFNEVAEKVFKRGNLTVNSLGENFEYVEIGFYERSELRRDGVLNEDIEALQPLMTAALRDPACTGNSSRNGLYTQVVFSRLDAGQRLYNALVLRLRELKAARLERERASTSKS